VDSKRYCLCLSVYLSVLHFLDPLPPDSLSVLVTQFCGSGSCSRKRGGGEEEPLLQSAADHGVVPCVDKRGSIAELTLGRTKCRTLVQVITIYSNDIKKEKYILFK